MSDPAVVATAPEKGPEKGSDETPTVPKTTKTSSTSSFKIFKFASKWKKKGFTH